MNPLALSLFPSLFFPSFLLSFPPFPLSLFPSFPLPLFPSSPLPLFRSSPLSFLSLLVGLGVPVVLGSFDSGRQAFRVYHLFCFLLFLSLLLRYHGAMDGRECQCIRVFGSTHRIKRRWPGDIVRTMELWHLHNQWLGNGGDLNRRVRALSLQNLLHTLLQKWPQI